MVLLYQDMTEVITLPWSGEDFVLSKYKTKVKKPFSKLSFYLCNRDMYEESQENSGKVMCPKKKSRLKKKIKVEEPIELTDSDNEIIFNNNADDTLPYVAIDFPDEVIGPNKVEVKKVIDSDKPQTAGMPSSSEIASCSEIASSSEMTYSDRYCQYSALLDGSDDEVEECMGAVYNEDTSETDEPNVRSEKDLKELIMEYIQTSQMHTTSTVIIWRARLLSTMLRYLSRPSFNINGRLKVEFSGEEAEDLGGPSREFLRLLMNEVGGKMGVFEGSANARVFTLDIKLLESEMYRKAGQLVAMSILNGGPGLACLAKPVFEYICGSTTSQIDVDLIQDENTKKRIKKLQDCSSMEDVNMYIVEHGEWVADVGYPDIYSLKLPQKEDVVNLLVKQTVLIRTSAAKEQFAQGLGNLLQIMMNHQITMMPLFVNENHKLTRRDFKKLYTVSFSENGSNNRTKEEETVYSFETFLEELEGNQHEISLEDLLIFMTGADKVPPLGFTKSINIDFYAKEENIRRYPYSSTCDLRLWLPRGSQPEELSELLEFAILNSHGFGKI